MNRKKVKIFQSIKNMTNDQFWTEMDRIHSLAYDLAVKHYTEAGQIVLTPKQQNSLHAKAVEIREVWDGISKIKVEVNQ